MTKSIALKTNVVETTIGCDPEVFFLRGDNVYPAIGMIGGTKEEPIPCNGGALQEDNVMAEFNTDPVMSANSFDQIVKTVLSEVEKIAITNQCTVGTQASKNINQITLDCFPMSKQFGCDPDYNAYTMKVNKTPDPESTLRTCAGHIHVGYDVDGGHSMEASSYLVKYLDAYVGTFCVLQDKDTRRMSRYGKAGAFRPKPYGTEYRVPSNFWIFRSSLRKEMFKRVREGYLAAKMGYSLPRDVARAINLQDKARCEEILKCLKR
jgi:hypothetical protein